MCHAGAAGADPGRRTRRIHRPDQDQQTGLAAGRLVEELRQPRTGRICGDRAGQQPRPGGGLCPRAAGRGPFGCRALRLLSADRAQRRGDPFRCQPEAEPHRYRPQRLCAAGPADGRTGRKLSTGSVRAEPGQLSRRTGKPAFQPLRPAGGGVDGGSQYGKCVSECAGAARKAAACPSQCGRGKQRAENHPGQSGQWRGLQPRPCTGTGTGRGPEGADPRAGAAGA